MREASLDSLCSPRVQNLERYDKIKGGELHRKELLPFGEKLLLKGYVTDCKQYRNDTKRSLGGW
jgi:hypothetical protein